MVDVVVPIQKESKYKVFDYDIKIEYYPESDEAEVPYKATPDAAGHDLYAGEATNILPISNAIVSLDLRWAIPKGFSSKIFFRSGLFLNHKITAELALLILGTEE